MIDPIIFAEVSMKFDRIEDADAALVDFAREPLPYEAVARFEDCVLPPAVYPRHADQAEETMTTEKSYDGSCFCGAVGFTATGAPEAMGYCHCASCRHWSAGPVNGFSLWKPTSLKVTKGADNIGSYNKTPGSHRKWCKTCGGHLFTDHPTFALVDIYAATIPTMKFEPALHVHYGESVLPVRDGLPKQKDMPKEMGGSGTLLPE